MKRNLIVGIFFILPFIVKHAHAKKIVFEDDFIDGIADIKQLEISPFPAGEYYVSIYLNGEFVKKQYVKFNPLDNIDVCITTALLKEIGVVIDSESSICNAYSQDLGLTTNFNFYKKKLDIFVKTKFVKSK
ncbi:TPA: fimbrial biogenesis outer membrane usher protein, partial [Escherichia coli]|nr:fimbrial biogenesis outer membrane usher protein [Escherichia coli]